MAKYNPDLAAQAREALKNPAYRDALNMISASEGTYNQGASGYNVRFGGNTFNSYAEHPNVQTSYRDRNGNMIPSTAAGRYQFLKSTWDDYATKLGLKDFSPESQDLAAIALMIERGAGPAIEKGDLNGIVSKLNNTWTSLPGSSIGSQHHGLRNPAFITGAYNQSRASHGATPVSFAWSGTTYNDADIPQGYGGRSQVQIPSFTENLLNSLGLNYQQGDFLRGVMSDILGKNYGADPNNIAPSSTLALSADPILSRANTQTLLNRLYNTDPNVSYGMGYSNGIRPTIMRTNPNTGAQQTLLEFPNGIYIDSETGERFSADGTPFVQEAVPVYVAPTESTQEVELVDDLGSVSSPSQGASTALVQPLTSGVGAPSEGAATIQPQTAVSVEPVETYLARQNVQPFNDLDMYSDNTRSIIRQMFRNA